MTYRYKEIINLKNQMKVSYNQIIQLFPNGGGGYSVGSKLLSPAVGMISVVTISGLF